MGFRIQSDKLQHQLEKVRRNQADSLEKLSSGSVFTSQDPRPAERAIAEGLEFRLRSLQASKRNVNDAVSLLQVGESSMSEINNMISRMKEINVAASNTTVTDRERRYLFIEYQALHDEITRVATTTDFNGIMILNGKAESNPDSLVFRVDAPTNAYQDSGPGGGGSDDDINVIRFDGLKDIVATAEGLGLKSAASILTGTNDDDGISVDDVQELLVPDEQGEFATVYDQALSTLSTQRAVFGAMQSRLHRSLDFIDVIQENYSAAKSKIADTDYASEVARMTGLNILTQAATSVLGQANFNAQLTLGLLNALGG
jgi:flagellin